MQHVVIVIFKNLSGPSLIGDEKVEARPGKGRPHIIISQQLRCLLHRRGPVEHQAQRHRSCDVIFSALILTRRELVKPQDADCEPGLVHPIHNQKGKQRRIGDIRLSIAKAVGAETGEGPRDHADGRIALFGPDAHEHGSVSLHPGVKLVIVKIASENPVAALRSHSKGAAPERRQGRLRVLHTKKLGQEKFQKII